MAQNSGLAIEDSRNRDKTLRVCLMGENVYAHGDSICTNLALGSTVTRAAITDFLWPAAL